MANLLDSIKTPVINVYNFANKLIASSNFKAVGHESPGVDIVSFKYEYDDEADDKCTIRFQASHTMWLDYLDIVIGDPITVSWGYLGGLETAKRVVVIRDLKSKYGPNVMYTDVICTDIATHLKLTNSPYTSKISPIGYLKQHCSGTLDIYINSAGKDLYVQRAYEKFGESRNEVSISSINTSVPQIPYRDLSNSPTTNTIIYNEEVPVGTWHVGVQDEVRKFMEKERDINVTNKSPYTVMYEIMQVCPYGPWFVSGRDGKLLIHNRNLGGVIYKSYLYNQEPGQLLDFTPETKFEAYSKNTISHTSNNPIEKSANFLESYITILDKLRSSKDIITDKGISDGMKEKELAEWLAVYNSGYQRFKTYRVGFRQTVGGVTFKTDKFEDKNYEDPSVAKRDATNIFNPLIKGPVNPSTYLDPLDTVLFGYQYVTPLTDLDEASNVVSNATRRLQMEKEEASAIIEGDPILQNNININIGNVQSQHTGTYYIKKCSHEIAMQGYKVTLEMLKVTDDAVINLYSDNKTYTSENKLVGSPGNANNGNTIQITPLVESYRTLVSKYFPPASVDDALRIIQAESAGDPNAFRPEEDNPGGGNDSGLFQINSKWHPEVYEGGDVFNAEYNIMAASVIFKKFGWSQWTTSKIPGVLSIKPLTKGTLVVKGEDKYKKEERIFRKWNITPVIAIGKNQNPEWDSGLNIAPSKDYDIYGSFDDYMKKYPDTNAKDLIRLYKEGKLKFKESNVEDL